MNRVFKLAVLLFSLAMLARGQPVTGDDIPGQETDSRLEPGQLELGRSVYNYRCYFCHGYSGDAQTLAARFLDPPPRNFTAEEAQHLDRQRMLAAVRDGRPNTAMKPFRAVLTPSELNAVVDYVRDAFMARRDLNTRYHTEENGWPDHERYRTAFPYATGDISLDAPPEDLTDQQIEGRKLYLRSCITCHDRSTVREPAVGWQPVALSYPRPGFKPGDSLIPPDAFSGATPFSRHEVPPTIANLTVEERSGERLFQMNCAFCHAADGTGRNWIGTFLEPSPRDLTDPSFMRGMTTDRLRRVIRDGLPGTSMPAWKHVLDSAQLSAVIAYVHRVFHPLSDRAE